jgi:sulfhydrogenase subunit delta
MSGPTIAIAGLTACFGCQLTLLNCEAELTELAARFNFAYFPMGMTSGPMEGEFDAAFVEGAVSTPEDLETLVHLRSRSRRLLAFGTCACWGGINAMKNHEPRIQLMESVYGRDAGAIDTFKPGPLHRFVTVDGRITGCPPEKEELLATLSALLRNALPVLVEYPVCMECRMRENLCLLLEKNRICLGPLVRGGCRARCPAVGIPCEGCRGPVIEANAVAEKELLLEKGFSSEEITSRMRRFCPEWDHAQES